MAFASPEEIRPLTRVEYHKLFERGVLGEDERVELIDGVLIRTTPPKPPHSGTIDFLNELLVLALAGRAWVRVQNPFAASDISEPQPDLCVVPRQEYLDDHPARAHLMIEVSHSLRLDRGRKRGLYAETACPEYWIVNLEQRQVEVYSEPVDGVYQKFDVHEPGSRITLRDFPDVTFLVSDFLR